MPTIQDTLTTIRDASHINAHALDLIADEADGQFQAIRAWPDSSIKRDLLEQLADVITVYRSAAIQARKLETVGQNGLQSMSSDPVAGPPAYPDIPTAGGVAQWSARDW